MAAELIRPGGQLATGRRSFLRVAGAAAGLAAGLTALSACGPSSAGGARPISAADWRALAQDLSGSLIRPGASAYTDDLRLFDPRFDGLRPAMTLLRAKNVADAVALGVGETRDAIVQVKQTVMAMVHGSISPRELSGPVGILAVGYKFAEQGSNKLLWFLSIISANLAVMNFLPIPVVDGGLFTFLVIEKLKGSPISQKTQSIAQVVGLVLLLSVFLFATWQDVGRIPLLFH